MSETSKAKLSRADQKLWGYRAEFESDNVHAPVAESCALCHDPHGSDNPGNLVTALPQLCLSCHEAGGESFVETHGGQDVAGSDCSSCHASR